MRGRLFTFRLIGISVVRYADGLCPLNSGFTLSSTVLDAAHAAHALLLEDIQKSDVHLVTVVTVVTSQLCKASLM